MSRQVYLDYAAATPVDRRVLAAMQPSFSDDFYNPSASYRRANKVSQKLEQARSKVASVLGTKPSEVIFTAGGTEADNLAIQGVMSQFLAGNIVVTGLEHDAVLAVAGSYDRRVAGVDRQGMVDLDDLAGKIDSQTVLVSVIYASNEVGTIQPIKKIADIIKTKRAERSPNDPPLYFHTDASQAANYLDLHVARLGVDMMTLNGGKIYGPKQSGALYVNSKAKLKPIYLGGGQERGFRSGTQNVAGNIGFAEALSMVQSDRKAESDRLRTLQRTFISLMQNEVPDAWLNGSVNHRLPNNLNFSFAGVDGERLLIELDEAGIMVSAGSACSAAGGKPSHVLKAMGLSDKDIKASLRFTMGRGTTAADIDFTVKTLAELLKKY